jgi:hypothetical protein
LRALELESTKYYDRANKIFILISFDGPHSLVLTPRSGNAHSLAAPFSLMTYTHSRPERTIITLTFVRTCCSDNFRSLLLLPFFVVAASRIHEDNQSFMSTSICDIYS